MMRHNARRQPPMGNEELHRSMDPLPSTRHPVRGASSAGTRHTPTPPYFRVLFVVGVLISGLMLPSAAQPPAEGAKLQPYTETLPKSLVKIDMLPIPGGTLTIRTKEVTVKPFWLARTETAWEAYDVFLA